MGPQTIENTALHPEKDPNQGLSLVQALEVMIQLLAAATVNFFRMGQVYNSVVARGLAGCPDAGVFSF